MKLYELPKESRLILTMTLMAVVLALLSLDEQGRKVLDNWGRFLFEIAGGEWPGVERL